MKHVYAMKHTAIIIYLFIYVPRDCNLCISLRCNCVCAQLHHNLFIYFNQTGVSMSIYINTISVCVSRIVGSSQTMKMRRIRRVRGRRCTKHSLEHYGIDNLSGYCRHVPIIDTPCALNAKQANEYTAMTICGKR